MEDVLQNLTTLGPLPLLIIVAVLVLAIVAMSTRTVTAGSTRRRLKQLRELRSEGMPQGRFHANHSSMRAGEEDDDDLEPEIPWPLKILSSVAASLPILGQKDREKVGILLHSAGIVREDALGLYIAAKLLVAAIGGLSALALTGWLEYPSSDLMRLAFTLGATILGGMIPEIILKRMVTKRTNSILKALPDALDLMVICTESGLSLDPTVKRVAKELRLSAPELAKELAIVSHELQVLPSREEALQNLARRNESRAIRSLVTTLVQSMKYGTSLAHALRVLANESRRERMLTAEEKAAKLPAKMSLPLVCCMLPAVFLIIGGPAITQVMEIR